MTAKDVPYQKAIKLFHFIAENFSLDDIKELILNLNLKRHDFRVDYENLAGNQKRGKARELVLLCHRHRTVHLLAEVVFEMRQQRTTLDTK